MKLTYTVIGVLVSTNKSHWLRPTPTMLAILATIFVVSGCAPHH